MATKTLEEQLAEVEESISAALKRQRWGQGGRSEDRPSLDVLFRERDRLERAVARQKAGGIRQRRVAPLG